VKRLRHFGIELVVRRLPEGLRHKVELLTPVVMAIVALVMIFQGWTILTFNTTRVFSTMDLTYTWAFLPIPLSGVLILVYLAQVEIDRWRGKSSAEGGHGQ
jgi:TRAP-type C4-dicarboxylate transport system permease small subunit